MLFRFGLAALEMILKAVIALFGLALIVFIGLMIVAAVLDLIG